MVRRRQLTLQASLVLSLLTTASTLSTGGDSCRRARVITKSNANNNDVLGQIALSSSPPSTTRTTRPRRRTTTTSRTAGISSTRQQRSGRRKKAVRPPLVDSDLLRFLGTQKKLKQNLSANTAAASSTTSSSSSSAASSSREVSLSSSPAAATSTSTSTSTSRRPVSEKLQKEDKDIDSSSISISTASLPSEKEDARITRASAGLPPKKTVVVEEGKDAAVPVSPRSTPPSVLETWVNQFLPFFGTPKKEDEKELLEQQQNTTISIGTTATTNTAPPESSTTAEVRNVAEPVSELSAPAGRGANETVSRVLSKSPPDPSSVVRPTLATTAEEKEVLEATYEVVEEDTAPGTVGDVMDSWLGQFNSHRVASVLMSKDGKLDEATALLAGERVQTQVLSRIARRRVRAFLKERDRKWGVQRRPATLSSSRETRIVAYGGIEDVVDMLLGFGLTAKDAADILIHTPGIALMRPQKQRNAESENNTNSNGECLEETVDRAFSRVLCGTLKLRKYDARKVLRNCPGLLTMRGSRSAEQIVNVLSRLGVSASSIARDKNALPTLLSRSPSGIFRLVAFLSSDAVRMPVSKIGPLLRRPICLELLDAVVPVPSFDRIRASDAGAGTTALEDISDPGVLSAVWGRSSQNRRDLINDRYRKMSKTAWTLRHEIGTADLSKVIAAYPSVLLLDADRQILPTANYLMNELGIWEDDLPRVLQLYPALLGMGVSQMERIASFLISLDVAPENLASIFRSFPALLTLDVDKDMMPVVEFLRTIGITNVGRFISRLPPVLGYSVDRELKPKWEFVDTVFVDARFEVTRFPAYFSYPLERVIKTRFEYLQKVKSIPVPLVALDQVLRYGDKDFAIKVAKDGDAGSAFLAFAEQRKAELASQGAKTKKRRRKKKAKKE